MINSSEEEKQTGILIESIKNFGGKNNSAPVIVIISDSTKTKGKSLEGKAQEIINLKMDEKFRSFPFSDKVYACAQVEEMMANKTDWLVWLNPDVLVLAPPVEITADKNAWACLRPVHMQNVGSIADAPATDFWKKIYQVTELDTNKIWTVESYVDSKKIRGYFNSGCMAFNPSKGILRKWKNDYKKLLSDSANYAFLNSNRDFSFFCHQAVLSAVVMAKAGKDKVHAFPPSYGYPLQLQDFPEFINKKHSISDLVIVICGDYKNLGKIEITEPYKKWIDTHVK